MNYEPVTKVLIDLDAFRNNIEVVRKRYPDSDIILPVKANAYGHDAVIISKEAEKLLINYLAVARVKEGLTLRENNIKLPIITLGVETGNNIEIALRNNIELSVSSLSNLLEIENRAKTLSISAKVHLKFDTGMSRLGCQTDEVPGLAKRITTSPNLIFQSLYTHLARSEESKEFTDKQINLFIDTKDKLEKANTSPLFYHLSNSGAILGSYKIPQNFFIRPGIMVYGYSPYEDENNEIIPVMTLVTKVIHIKKVNKDTGISYNHRFVTSKESLLATIPLGYGDGIRRSLTNKLTVTINGKNYSQRGTITMDLMVIEVDENVKLGDEVIIFGKKDQCINTAESLAKISNTISYEITTSISTRVDRIAVSNN